MYDVLYLARAGSGLVKARIGTSWHSCFALIDSLVCTVLRTHMHACMYTCIQLSNELP